MPPSPLVSSRDARAAVGDFALRELMAVREIAHAFLTAERPTEVFRCALERVSPLVGAAFSSVYLVDGESELMRLVAAWNWPERFTPWLGEMRVRIGHGPSGQAAAERRAVEVPDIFADPTSAEWEEVARELDVRALVALPLQTATGVLGAVTFYFSETGGFTGEQRNLLRIVADQMAATAEKASLIADLTRTNAALVESKRELEGQYVAALEARRVKDEFLANISHELRTPLTAVIGYCQIMEEEISGPLTEAQRGDLGEVLRSSEQLLALVNDLLELTTLKQGSHEIDLAEFDPAAPLRAALERVGEPPAGVRLVVQLPDGEGVPMRSDRGKIARLLTSLVSNAYKFTPRGEVTVSLEVGDGRAIYQVRDTGIGVPAEAQHLLFEEFRQVDGSATRRYRGTGLGLALARHLARLLGGDISAVSAVGEGSTFRVELPLECER